MRGCGDSCTNVAWVASEVHGAWKTAAHIETSLDLGDGAVVNSVSCPSAGNCSADGFYAAAGHREAFVVSERSGIWGRAREVPGIAALNRRYSQVNSISCTSPGNCAAGSYYASVAARVATSSSAAGRDAIFRQGKIAPQLTG
jgi:hypothetical protein